MKLSKSILQGLALGVALGGSISSCTTDLVAVDYGDTDQEFKGRASTVENPDPGTCSGPFYDCPACGMG